MMMLEILVVDDSEFDCAAVKKVVRALGNWHAEYVSSGAVALARMKEQQFDMLLTDLNMPRMSGLDLLRRAKKLNPAIPIVVMSAKGSAEAAIQALRLGATNYVIKKNMIHDLPGIVESIMRSSRSTRIESAILGHLEQTTFQFAIPSDRELVQGAVSYLQMIAEKFGKLPDAERTRLGICLEESLLNALIHGNLEVSSDLREGDSDAYEKLIALRLKQRPYRERMIEIQATFSPQQLVFAIRDEGPGFDVAAVPDPTTAENLCKPSGRGLMLMRIFMDSVEHNATGNQITLVKRLAPAVLALEEQPDDFAMSISSSWSRCD